MAVCRRGAESISAASGSSQVHGADCAEGITPAEVEQLKRKVDELERALEERRVMTARHSARGRRFRRELGGFTEQPKPNGMMSTPCEDPLHEDSVLDMSVPLGLSEEKIARLGERIRELREAKAAAETEARVLRERNLELTGRLEERGREDEEGALGAPEGVGLGGKGGREGATGGEVDDAGMEEEVLPGTTSGDRRRRPRTRDEDQSTLSSDDGFINRRNGASEVPFERRSSRKRLDIVERSHGDCEARYDGDFSMLFERRVFDRIEQRYGSLTLHSASQAAEAQIEIWRSMPAGDKAENHSIDCGTPLWRGGDPDQADAPPGGRSGEFGIAAVLRRNNMKEGDIDSVEGKMLVRKEEEERLRGPASKGHSSVASGDRQGGKLNFDEEEDASSERPGAGETGASPTGKAFPDFGRQDSRDHFKKSGAAGPRSSGSSPDIGGSSPSGPVSPVSAAVPFFPSSSSSSTTHQQSLTARPPPDRAVLRSAEQFSPTARSGGDGRAAGDVYSVVCHEQSLGLGFIDGRITSVQEKSWACRSGIGIGDGLLEVNDFNVEQLQDGETVELLKHRRRPVSITLRRKKAIDEWAHHDAKRDFRWKFNDDCCWHICCETQQK